MKNLFTIFLLVSIASASFAQQSGKAGIKGKIVTSDGQPGSFVTVQIKNMKSGTVSDEKGNYHLRNVPVGKHILLVSIVGFESVELGLETTEGQTLNAATIQLKEDAKTLLEVTVKGNFNRFSFQKDLSYLKIQR